MTNQVAKAQTQLPAHLASLFGDADKSIFDEYSGGVKSGFPVISYRGKVWRVKAGGEEHINVDANGDALPSIEVVLLKSNPIPSKIHYDKQYAEGDDGKPRCWSANGIKPDVDVENPINPVCASCPNNQWGSRITENGKKSRACSDVRRMAVVFAHELEDHVINGAELSVKLLRVPPASLNPLKEYVEKMLKPKGVPPFVLVTRLGFDAAAAYPKLTFKPSRFLTEAETPKVLALRDGDEVHAILAESTEYSPEGTTEATGDVAGEAAATAGAAETKASAPSGASKKKKKKKKKAATPAEAEAAAAASTAVAEPDEEDDPMAALMGVAAAVPAPVVVSKPKAVAKDEAEDEDEDEDEEEASEETPAGDDFDAMLDNLLGDD